MKSTVAGVILVLLATVASIVLLATVIALGQDEAGARPPAPAPASEQSSAEAASLEADPAMITVAPGQPRGKWM